jgi:SAM-dependent methyltransferase
MIQRAESITHEHILSIINSERDRFCEQDSVRILDVGCGNCHLISYLNTNLAILNSSANYQIYGLDVVDHGVQKEGFFDKSMQFLSEKHPITPWHCMISAISVNESWPYPENFFDIILSNQVAEHVGNHDQFFSEIHRTLRRNGFSVHLFPLKNCVYEWHLHLPFVHRIYNFDRAVVYIKFLSLLGLGKYRKQKMTTGCTIDDYSERHADYLFHFTNYISENQVLSLAKKHHLRISFKYTPEFYSRKMRSILSLRPTFFYKTKRSFLIEWIEFFFLKYISSITAFLVKNERYTKP